MYSFSEWNNTQVDELIDYVVDDINRLHIGNLRKKFGYFYKPNINLVDDELIITLQKNFDYLPDADVELVVGEYADGNDLLCVVTQIYYKDDITLWDAGNSTTEFDDIVANISSAMSYLAELNELTYVLEDFIE